MRPLFEKRQRHSNGAIIVTEIPPGSFRSRSEGWGQDDAGASFVTFTRPDPPAYREGLVLSQNGALFVAQGGTMSTHREGYGLTSTGALMVSTASVSGDAKVGGIPMTGFSMYVRDVVNSLTENTTLTGLNSHAPSPLKVGAVLTVGGTLTVG